MKKEFTASEKTPKNGKEPVAGIGAIVSEIDLTQSDDIPPEAETTDDVVPTEQEEFALDDNLKDKMGDTSSANSKKRVSDELPAELPVKKSRRS